MMPEVKFQRIKVCDNELENIVRISETPIEYRRFPCQYPSCGKAVIEASVSVIGRQAIDGLILSKIRVKAMMRQKEFETKKDHQPN